MTFAQPLWFWALAALPLLIAIFIANEGRRAKLVRKLVALRLEGRLAGSASAGKRRARFLLLLLGLACVIVSLAQPRWGFTWLERKTSGLDVIIALDTSRSMLANDLLPNRLLRAKLAAEDLITQLAGNRIGLVAFAGSSFLQAPLTADQSAILNALRELDTEVIPLGGTNIADAIRTAADAFGKGESDSRALVIFTDGEELDTDGQKAADEHKELFRIFTVGVGSKEGTVIALPNQGGGTDYLKDPQGQIVKSRLDETRLRAIAEGAGGFYLHLQAGLADMQRLYRDGLSTMNETEVDTRLSRQPIERYQWPLGAGMVLLVLSTLIGERRRGAVPRAVAAAIVLACLAVPDRAAASLNPGVDAYQREEYKRALETFSRQLQRQPQSPELQYNIGSAAYKAGDIDRALQAFSQALTATDPALRSKAAYNLGNTLVQRGLAQKEKKPKIQELKNAIQHYDTALQANAENGDAEFNRDAVRKLIEQLEKEEQQQKKEDQKKDQEKKDQEKQDEKDQEKKDGKGDDKDQQKQQSDKKDESQQGKDEQKKEQSGGGPEEKDQQGKEDSKDPSEAGKDGEPKDEKGGEKSPEPKPGEGEDREKTDQAKSGQEGDDPKEQDGMTPEPPEPKKEGELKSNPAPGGEGEEPGEQEEAAAEAAAAAEGRMTEAQAKSLLESLKSEDERVQILNPRDRRGKPRVLRDW